MPGISFVGPKWSAWSSAAAFDGSTLPSSSQLFFWLRFWVTAVLVLEICSNLCSKQLPVTGHMDHEVAVAHCNILCWTFIEDMKHCSSIWWVHIALRSQLWLKFCALLPLHQRVVYAEPDGQWGHSNTLSYSSWSSAAAFYVSHCPQKQSFAFTAQLHHVVDKK